MSSSSNNAAKELEDAASLYAAQAIRLDSQGAVGSAIQMYQKAISKLITLSKIYPDYKLNRLYIQRANTYRERIKTLQTVRGVDGTDDTGPKLVTRGGKEENSPSSSAPFSQSHRLVEPLRSSYEDLVLAEKPSVKWEELVGLEDAKKAIQESMIFPMQRPDLFPLGWPRGILLFGPPGCGKTLLAAATASSIDGYFMSIDAASIMSKWLGEAEKNVAKLFGQARKELSKDTKAVVIFIDELDSLLGTRNQEVGGEIRVKNQFLKEMDGIEDKGKNLHLYVVGATNKPWSLDWPFLRRFQKRIYVPLPDVKARTKMLELYTTPLKLDSDVKPEELAKLADGYTGSDIRDVCQGAQLEVVWELFDSGKADDGAEPREINLADFKNIFKTRKPSVSPEMIRAYSMWSENFKAL